MARKRLAPPPANHDRWLISYADFVTLLLALFVVLFASSQLDKRKALQVSYAVSQALEKGGALQQGGVPRAKPLPSTGAASEPKLALPELKASLNYLHQALAEEIRLGKVEIHLDNRGLVISLR